MKDQSALTDDEIRVLSTRYPIATADKLRPGVRVHYNSGWPHTSWTAEVRSEWIDGEAIVVRRTACDGGRFPRYVLVTSSEIIVWTSERHGPAPFRIGPAPRGLRR